MFKRQAITNFSSAPAIQGIIAVVNFLGAQVVQQFAFGMSAGCQRSSRRLSTFSLNFPDLI